MSLPLTPYDRWESGTNQNSVPANDNSLRDEIFNTNGISNAGVTAQPALTSPADDGKWYILAATHTGAQWATFSPKSIAIFYSGNWYEFVPAEGNLLTVAGAIVIFTGGAWVAFTVPTTFTGGALTSALDEAKGSNIASATTTNIGAATGNFVHITGTTTITGLGTVQAGTRRIVIFDGILTLTHNATSLILPTGANITTAAGDAATFVSEGSGNWRCVAYQRANGQALAGGGGSGDVVGPASATADAIVIFNSTTGKLVKDSAKTIASLRAPAIQAVTSSATVTPTFADDLVKVTAQAAALALANPTGTAIPGLGIVIRIKDNGTARAISYDTQYRAIGVTLPTTTVISKTLYLAMIYNSDDTKWDVVAVGQEA